MADNISEYLIFFEKRRGWSARDVESMLGWHDKKISKVKTGYEPLSEKLEAGLKLLKRVIELEDAPPPKSNRELILELQQRVAALERGLQTLPDPHRQSIISLNEPPVSYGPPADTAVALLHAALVAVGSAAARKNLPDAPAPAKPDHP